MPQEQKKTEKKRCKPLTEREKLERATRQHTEKVKNLSDNLKRSGKSQAEIDEIVAKEIPSVQDLVSRMSRKERRPQKPVSRNPFIFKETAMTTTTAAPETLTETTPTLQIEAGGAAAECPEGLPPLAQVQPGPAEAVLDSQALVPTVELPAVEPAALPTKPVITGISTMALLMEHTKESFDYPPQLAEGYRLCDDATGEFLTPESTYTFKLVNGKFILYAERTAKLMVDTAKGKGYQNARYFPLAETLEYLKNREEAREEAVSFFSRLNVKNGDKEPWLTATQLAKSFPLERLNPEEVHELKVPLVRGTISQDYLERFAESFPAYFTAFNEALKKTAPATYPRYIGFTREFNEAWKQGVGKPRRNVPHLPMVRVIKRRFDDGWRYFVCLDAHIPYVTEAFERMKTSFEDYQFISTLLTIRWHLEQDALAERNETDYQNSPEATRLRESLAARLQASERDTERTRPREDVRTGRKEQRRGQSQSRIDAPRR